MKLNYNNKSINTLSDLAIILSIEEEKLIKIASSARDYYKPNKPNIKNGKKRQTYTVNDPLYTIQDNILKKIINKVNFPIYLQGAIKDNESPRDYVRDATLHANNKILLKEDISNFFPSTRKKLVQRMWEYFFKFPRNVSIVLTDLTTYKGFIPQGASTSSAVANLVFWEHEPTLENKLREKGYLYTRYIDDISVSFKMRISKNELQNITAEIYGMFKACGLKPNRDKDENGFLKKRTVRSRNKPMVIHGLNINSGRPTMPKKDRYRIRAAVRELEFLIQSNFSKDELEKKLNSITGRINSMNRFHPRETQKYIIKLGEIKKKLDGA